MLHFFNLFQPAPEAGTDKVAIVGAATVKDWLGRGEAVLIDVREPQEHAAERIPGALSMPLSRLDPAAIPHAPDKKLVLHCHSGSRCGFAAMRLVQANHPGTIHRMRGGIIGWVAAGGEVTRG